LGDWMDMRNANFPISTSLNFILDIHHDTPRQTPLINRVGIGPQSDV
jgi:hypothetical protein